MSGAAVQFFDLRDEPHELAAGKWSPHVVRDPEDMLGVVLHSWAVKQVGTTPRNRRTFGEPLALARRGLATPYTIVCGVTGYGGVPVVGLCHPVSRYTHASDAGNARYLSIGIMGRFALAAERTSTVLHTPVTPALAAAVNLALEVAASLLAEAGQHAPVLLTHRQCANGLRDHFACPGEEAVRMALQAPAILHFEPDPNLLPPGATHGRVWPDAWRRHLQRRTPGEVGNLVHPLHEQLEV